MNILVSGALGRMGNEIVSCIRKDNDLTFICGFDHDEGSLRKYSYIQ